MAACGSCGAPCESEPFRCACERDCWVGDPEEYADCMAACAAVEDCELPVPPVLPSHGGERCPVEGYDDCVTAAEDTYTAAVAACDAGTGPSDGCHCYGEAMAVRQESLRDCELAALPGWLQCLKDKVTAEAECCDVDLGHCYETCDNAFIDAVTDYETAFFHDRRTAAAEALRSYTVPVDCAGSSDACCFRPLADLDVIPEVLGEACYAPNENYDHAVCRATCERDEIDRDTPEDRKRRRCGGREHLCLATCAAQQEKDSTNDFCDQESCAALCGGDADCRFDCEVARFESRRRRQRERLACDTGCCEQEHRHVRHGHAKANCEYACAVVFFSDALACASDFLSCGATSPTEAAVCRATYAACMFTATNHFTTCRDDNSTPARCGSLVGDCPDCFDFDPFAIDGPPEPALYCGCYGCGCNYCEALAGCARASSECHIQCDSDYNNCLVGCPECEMAYDACAGFCPSNCETDYDFCAEHCPAEGEDGHEDCVAACVATRDGCRADRASCLAACSATRDGCRTERATCISGCEDTRTDCYAGCVSDESDCDAAAADDFAHCVDEGDRYQIEVLGLDYVCGESINPATGVPYAWPDDC